MMKPTLSMGVVEVVYNTYGHTYWVSGIIDANGTQTSLEFHFQAKRGQNFEEIVEGELRNIHPEYFLGLRDITHPVWHKDVYLYEVLW